jgi:hypothetical protein
MGLTLQQAIHAGDLARELQTLQANIPMVQGAIAGNFQIISVSADTTGGQLNLSDLFSLQDTQTVLNTILSIAQARVTAINSELAGM